MINKSFLLAILALTGCTNDVRNTLADAGLTKYKPNLKVGDCVVHTTHDHLEKWEHRSYDIVRITAVGDEKYLAVSMSSSCAYLILHAKSDYELCYESMTFKDLERIYYLKSNNCPNLEDLLPKNEE